MKKKKKISVSLIYLKCCDFIYQVIIKPVCLDCAHSHTSINSLVYFYLSDIDFFVYVNMESLFVLGLLKLELYACFG